MPLLPAGACRLRPLSRRKGLIAAHGAPLILKRDRGSNQCDDAVQVVLERHLIIPLDSPRQYPQYNGAVEYAQREMKEVLEVRYPLAEQALAVHAAAAQELNHRRRPCLDGRSGRRLQAPGFRLQVRQKQLEAWEPPRHYFSRVPVFSGEGRFVHLSVVSCQLSVAAAGRERIHASKKEGGYRLAQA